MRKTTRTLCRIVVNAVLFAFLSITVSAQKLANIQEGSIWAPANIKVDAQLNDWNNTLQAYNKTIDVFYTIANTETNLFLVIKSGNQTINNKIIGGGVNFTINTEGKKKEKDAFVVTFPVVDMVNLRKMVMQFAGGMGRQQQAPDSAAIANMRKKAISIDKEIKLVGFKDVPDSVISIYNEYGIKAAIDFDSKGSLIVEMLIPLKYLHIAGGKDASFVYNLKLNGINLNGIIPGGNAAFSGGAPGGGGFGGDRGGGGGGFGSPRVNAGAAAAGMADIANLINPTDFWAKYVLAKK